MILKKTQFWAMILVLLVSMVGDPDWKVSWLLRSQSSDSLKEVITSLSNGEFSKTVEVSKNTQKIENPLHQFYDVVNLYVDSKMSFNALVEKVMIRPTDSEMQASLIGAFLEVVATIQESTTLELSSILNEFYARKQFLDIEEEMSMYICEIFISSLVPGRIQHAILQDNIRQLYYIPRTAPEMTLEDQAFFAFLFSTAESIMDLKNNSEMLIMKITRMANELLDEQWKNIFVDQLHVFEEQGILKVLELHRKLALMGAHVDFDIAVARQILKLFVTALIE